MIKLDQNQGRCEGKKSNTYESVITLYEGWE